MRRTLSLFCYLFIATSAFCQVNLNQGSLAHTNSDTSCTNGNSFFQKTYGGNKEELATSLVSTADSSYVMTAWTKSFGAGVYDGYLHKVDKDGNQVWSKAFGGTSDDYFYGMKKTNDNGFIACGQTKSFGNTAGDAWLVKVDASGNLQWAKKYGDGNIYGDIAIDVIQLSDGGYAFCGVHRFSPGQSQSWVVRTNNVGNVIWSKQFGNSGSDECWGLLEDGNYLLVVGFYQGLSYYDGYIMKLDNSNGSMIWINGYDAENRSTRNEKLARTTNGYQLFSYLLDDYIDTNQQSVVWNLGLDGTVQNIRKTVIPGIKSSSMGWFPAMDGGFTITNSEANNNNADIILARVSTSGTVGWSKKFSIPGKQFSGSAIEPNLEGGWAALAVSNSVGNLPDSNNLLLIKTDNVGNSGSCPAPNTNDLTVVIPGYSNPTPNVVALGDVPISGVIITSVVTTTTPATNTFCYSCLQLPLVINSYTPALALNPCENKITVEDASAFNIGDTVLLIQMKGAVIDSSNTSSFGTITDYKNAGNYEFNFVNSKSGNIIQLKNSLTRQYDFQNGKVQLIRVPYYQNVSINEELTCLPWDGNKGGVLVLSADSINLNANIDVSGMGFRGGNDPFSNPTPFYCYENQYYYPPNPDLASEKGESIATISSSKSFGKGRLGNGGGGGNSHNSGGGGGGNGAIGGLGGYEYEGVPCNTTVPFDNRGIGGNGLTYSNATNKIFMGGGGGAGQSNNLEGFSSKGGNGGGIIIIVSNKLKSNHHQIRSNGDNGVGCNLTGTGCHEGMGGGGAGGTILLKVNNYIDSSSIEMKGGKGADMITSGYLRLAPGGGGGGGITWFSNPSLPTNAVVAANAGTNGVCTGYSNDPWGATAGQNGISLFNLQIPFDVVLFKSNIDSVRIKDSVTNCQSFNFKGLAYTNTNPISSWQWSFGDGGTANTQNANHNYAGAGSYTVKLVVTDNNGCKDSVTTNVTASVLTADAGADTTVCANTNTIVLHGNSAGATQFAWSPAQYLNDSSLQNPTATPLATIKYYLVATNAQNCSAKDSVTISVRALNAFTIDPPVAICINDSIVLQASGGDNYTWSPGTQPNSSSILVFPQNTTNYSVLITDTVCSYTNNLSTIVTVLPLPAVNASKSGDIDCTTDFSQLNATGATQYLWSPATTLNNPNIANPIAKPTVKTTYSVKGTDVSGCVNYDTITVDITAFNKGEYLMPSAFTPNGDGLNDCYGIKYWGVIEKLEFSIYNRWGEKIFATKTPGACWDGTYKGVKQDSNVFVYLIKAKTSCGEVTRKGTFALIR